MVRRHEDCEGKMNRAMGPLVENRQGDLKKGIWEKRKRKKGKQKRERDIQKDKTKYILYVEK